MNKVCMKRICSTLFFVFAVLQVNAQNEFNFVREFIILDYVIDHQSEINKYLKNKQSDWFFDKKKVHVCANKKKIELSIIRNDTNLSQYCGLSKEEMTDRYTDYFFNNSFDTAFVNIMNHKLDSTFRKGKSINYQKKHVDLTFSDSFCCYISIYISHKNSNKCKQKVTSAALEMIFKFDSDNMIQSVLYQFWCP